MDKAQFVERAPRYYALGIISEFLRERDPSPITGKQIVADLSYTDPDNPEDPRYRMHEGKLLNLAIKHLVEDGLVEVEHDDFGPSLIVPVEGFAAKFRDHWEDPTTLYSRFMRVGRTKQSWLFEALDNLAREELRLGIQDTDYESPEIEWAPIPVNRGQPEMRAVIDALDDATEKVRSDNGYTATKTEERDYVLDGLSTFSKRLKEATTISIPYIRQYAIEPLARASKSLGRSVAGMAIEVLKAKLKTWLMAQSFTTWPTDWFS